MTNYDTPNLYTNTAAPDSRTPAAGAPEGDGGPADV